MSKKNTWTVILSSGPQSPIKQFQLRKLVIYFSITFLMFLFVLITGLSFTLKNVTKENQNLIVQQDQLNAEITKVKQDYFILQQEALTVQRSIEEFKFFEEQISNLNLEMPADLNRETSDGSGGLVLPMHIEKDSKQPSPKLLGIKDELPELIEKFEATVLRLTEYESELRTIPTITPTAEGRITSKYGNRRDPFTWRTRFHSGIDIAAPLNTPIYSAADGIVTMAEKNGGYGLTVVIQHNDTYETLYAHLNRIDVEVGDKVQKGNVIGGMGSTGRSTGVHLHYEIKRDGEPIDPYSYMMFHKQSQ